MTKQLNVATFVVILTKCKQSILHISFDLGNWLREFEVTWEILDGYLRVQLISKSTERITASINSHLDHVQFVPSG